MRTRLLGFTAFVATLILATAAPAVTSAAPAVAAAAPAAPAAAATPSASEYSKLMLVLDASHSMSEPTGGGGSRIDAARNALTTIISQLPQGQEVGMRVYGQTDLEETDPAACTDSERLVDIGSDNRAELTAAVGRYTPAGWTPTGYALQQAGKDLGKEGARSIVLVSDGLSTCDPKPCDVAAELAADGLKVRIDVVGLNVPDEARDELSCVAETAGGTYVDAENADEIVQGITDAVIRASKPFDLDGKPVKGTPTSEGAPMLAPTGKYLDVSAGAEESKVYRVARSTPGSALHVGFTAGAGQDNTIETELKLSTPDGAYCASAYSGGVLRGKNPYLFGGASVWAEDPEGPCMASSELLITMQGDETVKGRPLQLALYEEPPRSTNDPPGDVPAEPKWQTMEPGEPSSDVAPGLSLATAPVIEDGSYALDINNGETQVFAVPLDWGQSLQAQVDGKVSPSFAKDLGWSAAVNVDVIGSVRADASVLVDPQPTDWSVNNLVQAEEGEKIRRGAMTNVIAYQQREDIDRDASVPGLHYVRVNATAGEVEANQPYTLTIRRIDDPNVTAPSYAEAGSARAPRADSALVDPVEGAVQPTAGASPSASPEPSVTPEPSASGESNGGGGIGLLGVLLAVVGALVVGAAVTFFVLRRKKPAASPGSGQPSP